MIRDYLFMILMYMMRILMTYKFSNKNDMLIHYFHVFSSFLFVLQ